MSRLYVYALAGSPIAPFTSVRRRVHSIDLDGVHVVADRRTGPVTPSEDSLRRQHAVVEAVAARAEAVLPARFGSYVELAELRRILAGNRDAVHAALEVVRGREQMTLRIPESPRATPLALESPAVSGTAYLEARRASGAFPHPEVLEPIRRALAGLVHAERIQPGRGAVPASVCHLVTKGQAAEYRARIEEVAGTLPGPTPRVSGPWPAFAFTPELF